MRCAEHRSADPSGRTWPLSLIPGTGVLAGAPSPERSARVQVELVTGLLFQGNDGMTTEFLLYPLVHKAHTDYWFWCSGCKSPHMYRVGALPLTGKSEHTGPLWLFNGDMEAPVFSPSLLNSWPQYRGPDGLPKGGRCHLYVGAADGTKPGHIQYLNDCTHQLAGQTVKMENWKGFHSRDDMLDGDA